jgi:hypothetical protein
MAHFQASIPAHRIFTTRVSAPVSIGVVPTSIVMVSLTEMGRSNPTLPLHPIMGDATMKVYNVVPETNAVIVRGEVDWDTDLEIQITIAVVT